MATAVKPKPDGYHSITPYLCVKNAASALEFYKRAFGATEIVRMQAPDGKIGHAEIKIGDSPLMLADEFPEMDFLSPQSVGGTPTKLYLYVENVDEVVNKAVEAGAMLSQAVEDKFYGDRSGTITDPFGHVWYVATHIEDLAEEEIRKRAEAAMGGGA